MFIPAVLENGFVIVGVEPFWQQVAVGAVLIVAVYLDQLRRRRSSGNDVPTHRRRVQADRARIDLDRCGLCRGARARRRRVWRRRRHSSSSGGSASSSGGEKKNYKMTLIAGVKGDEFYITMNCGAQAKAKELGVTLDFQGPDEFDAVAADADRQRRRGQEARRRCSSRRPTRRRCTRRSSSVADAGSKVVLVDTTLEQADMAVSQIASDNKGGGSSAATTLGELIGGTGKVFVVNVKPGISTTDLREQGFVEKAKEARPRLRRAAILQRQARDAAAAVTKAALAKNPDLKGIFATNLFSAEGAATGVREAGSRAR